CRHPPPLAGGSQRVASTRTGAGNRRRSHTASADAQVHLRRGRDEVFVLAEVHQRAIRRRVLLAQATIDRRRQFLTGRAESLAGYHFEEIAATEGLQRRFHHGLVGTGAMIAADARGTRAGCEGCGGHTTRQVSGGESAVAGALCEIVDVLLRHATLVIHHQQAVRQIQHEVAVLCTARETLAHRLELEGQLVTEGTVESEVDVLITGEQREQATQRGEHAALPRALFLETHRLRRLHVESQSFRCTHEVVVVLTLGERWRDELQQHLAAPVQRFEREAPATRHDAQWRRAEAEVPARITPGLFTTRAEQDARRTVEHRFQCGARSLTVNAIAGAVYVQTTARTVVAGGHGLHVVLRCFLRVVKP